MHLFGAINPMNVEEIPYGVWLNIAISVDLHVEETEKQQREAKQLSRR